MAELEKHFVVVMWDQRGAGKSYKAITPNIAINIDQFVSDTYELTQLLCKRFQKKKIYLVGHSWGSTLGVLTAQKYPNLYYAYIGIGQAVNMQESRKLSYKWTMQQAEKAGNTNDVQKLKKIGEQPYNGDWVNWLSVQDKLLQKYRGGFHGSSQDFRALFMESMMTASEYTLLDKINFFRGPLGSAPLLLPEMIQVDFIQQAPVLEVPVYFVLGRHDYQTVSSLAEEYYKILKAPQKELIWFEKSGHWPNLEETKKLNNLLIKNVIQATYTK